jgi:formate--tetrahydrofolate ligase
LSENITDLKKRIDNIVIAENSKQEPIYAKDIKASGAMTAILKDAILPNLVQTLEQTPALIHGGPFANIAHGTSSIIAARSALALSDYVVTEAGFGADLGAEKFFDIFARQSNLYPDAVVLVATIRALKMHGGVKKEELNQENLTALKEGFANLKAHITNIRKFGYNPIIAINKFVKDTNQELQLLNDLCAELNVTAVLSEGWEKGGNGCIDLANAVINQIENKTNIYSPLHLLYPSVASLKEKIEIIAKEIYNAKDVSFTEQVLKDLEKFSQWGYQRLPVCIAKTQNSISHDKKLLGAPSGFTFPITEVRLSAGAGFVVALSGEITTMPGLPKVPAAENIDVDENGIISGLF